MRRVTTALVLTAALSTAMAGCSSSPDATGPSTPASVASAAGAAPGAGATRWWTNAAAVSGSTIDPGSDVAARLHPSRPQYCSMLRQTIASGHTVLSGLRPGDPTYAATTTAFVTELQRVAPAAVAPAWRTLGTTILSLVDSGGNPSDRSGVDASRIRTAAATVGADARARCGVSVARTTRKSVRTGG